MERLSEWMERRSAPVAATAAMLVLVMAFSLLGHSLFHIGRSSLVSPSDLWSLANSSAAILHGHVSHIYVANG